MAHEIGTPGQPSILSRLGEASSFAGYALVFSSVQSIIAGQWELGPGQIFGGLAAIFRTGGPADAGTPAPLPGPAAEGGSARTVGVLPVRAVGEGWQI